MSGFAFTIVNSIALLTLVSLGLAIVFGTMRVINFAHGEFIMLAGYAAVLATDCGLTIWIAMLAVSPVAVGLVGAIAERLIIRRLYGHLVTTVLATVAITAALVCLSLFVLNRTRWGLIACGTMQNAEIAASVGNERIPAVK